jgi:hypothetical protein
VLCFELRSFRVILLLSPRLILLALRVYTFMLPDRSRRCIPKNVTLTFDCLAVGEYTLEGLVVLCLIFGLREGGFGAP